MAKLGYINFDNRILDAARDGTLVVFAGAGVSMGSPSNSPDFKKLALDIAKGTEDVANNPLDRFLGELQHRGIPVHHRAAERLSVPGSIPTKLHHHLLKLFPATDRVRIVTTNFDLHFQVAAKAVFGAVPELYRAPALPRGDRFAGIVHVHGMLTHPEDLVLTDADFGRAYLTEGWARRFLVDVFRQYTVLFVGYSHDDVVMTYLARALPADGLAGRFALTEKEGSWKLLGITPVRFPIGVGNAAFQELDDGIRKLSELTSRGVLDWQTRLTELGEGTPPIDDEAVDEVEHALREVHTTRFPLKVARGVGWLRWLHDRKHLAALFHESELNEREQLLATWVTAHFAIEYVNEVFELIAANGVQLNPWLWRALALELGSNEGKQLSDVALGRWVSILLESRPRRTDWHSLCWLAKRCGRQGMVDLVLRIFLRLCQHRLSLKQSFRGKDGQEAEDVRQLDADCAIGEDYFELDDIWKNQLKPNLAAISLPLLASVTRILGEIHEDLVLWGMASEDWDPNSYHRSAIEPHAQDRFQEPIDVLIDAARDALEWLAETRSAALDGWLATANTSIPLLRRLAVHAITIHNGMSPDERLGWILAQVSLTGNMWHHEVYRAVELSYPVAGEPTRKTLVEAVLAISLPEAFDWTSEQMTDRAQFDWLSWLLRTSPDCPIASAALKPIEARHPEWEPSEHPDLTHWSGPTLSIGSESPWSVDQLLAMPPSAQFEQLATYESTQFSGFSKVGLLAAIAQASKQQPQWGLRLVDALTKQSLLKSDLWRAVLRGLQESAMTANDWAVLLTAVSNHELYTSHSYEIATLLHMLVRDGGKSFALDLLGQSNEIAHSVWQSIEPTDLGSLHAEWLEHAINHPSGIIVQFWLAGLALLMHGKSGNNRSLPSAYKLWFEQVLEERSSKGGHGRTLLASQVTFLFGLDGAWTRKYVLPLFVEMDPLRFEQVWGGFLVWGTLSHTIVPEMLPAFELAIERLTDPRHRCRFLEFFTALAVFHVDDPTEDLLPALFQKGSLDDRIMFASWVGHFLQSLKHDAKNLLWDRWLERYWTMRLDAIPEPLDPKENRQMLKWLPNLDDHFPTAVSFVVRAPVESGDLETLLFRLRESVLVKRFPKETAQLLIYLCDYVTGYSLTNLRTIANKLPHLVPEIQQQLDANLARIGA